MFKSYYRRFVFILIIIAGAIWIVLPGNPGIHLSSWQKEFKVIQGLDLQGGLRVLLEADLPATTEIAADQLDTAASIIEKRVNALGVTEPIVQVAGTRRILVELPGIGDPAEAVATLKETGLLEFIEMSIDDVYALTPGQRIQTDFGLNTSETSTENLPTTTPTAEETQATPTEELPAPTPSDGEAQPTPSGDETTSQPAEKIFHTVLTGAALENAGVTRDSVGNISVGLTFTTDGAQIFADYTASHIGGILGIVLDKQLISYPRITQAIPGGNASITGNYTLEEANNLAVQLRYGSLPIPLKVVENKTVGPTLGQDSLQKSTVAGLIGLSVVMAFMILYYRLPGFLADLALLCYATITFALFKAIPVTLTLPGIAGFVLSIGVAVDANVLIFERLKEELRSGRNLHKAIDLGFSRAWPSIRDSNISTLITCLILYWFGNTFGASIVKGFSITLALGVLVSLFTAITVTRTFLHIVLDNIRFAEHPRWFGV
ncbi:MAG: protein translocase subunit SecD [Anaerolineales bacterium]|jgi:preprotein translocase subunit SecD